MEFMSDVNVRKLTVLMCCFIERSLLKMKPRLQMIPTNRTSVLFRDCMWVLQGCVDRIWREVNRFRIIIQLEFVFFHPYEI